MTPHLSAATVIDSLAGSGYLRQRQIIPGIIPISSATLWRWISAGKFPAPVKLSERVTAWRTEDIRVWMAARAAQEGLSMDAKTTRPEQPAPLRPKFGRVSLTATLQAPRSQS